MSVVLRWAKTLAATSLALVLASAKVMASGGCFVELFPNFLQAEFPGSQTLSLAGCQTCHALPSGGNNFNRYGAEIVAKGANCSQTTETFTQILLTINSLDSDGEGSTNAVELAAGTQPGWCNTGGCTNPVGTTPPNVQLDPAPPSEPPVANVQPDADPGGPYRGEPGVEIVFDGSRSSDPNGDTLVSYSWDFGDSTTGSGVSPRHTYAAPGDYRVSLVVNDGELDSLIATTTATIAAASDVPPPDDSLYAINCAGCHGDPWGDPAIDDTLAGKRRIAGARSCNIRGSIFGNSVFPEGAPGMQSLQTLTDEEIDALADYLNSEPTSGERRYVSTCAGCHGDTGEGGRVGEDVHGDSAHETWEAIREESEMRYLSCMPEEDVDTISAYLAGYDDDYDRDGIGDDEDDDDDNDGIPDDEDDDDDNDGVSDEDEYENGTDPRDDDTDDDGLDDGEEREYGCDPKDPDTDDDGRMDGVEVHTLGTNPLVADNFDSRSSSGGGAPAIPALLALLLVGLGRRIQTRRG